MTRCELCERPTRYICADCDCCEDCCECDDTALFDADELGLDPETDHASA